MNWEAIGAAGEIIGAIAVLVTLIYLAVQVRESSKATRLQTAQSTFHLSFEMVSLFTSGKNPEVWSKFRREGATSLTSSEQVSAGSILISLFTTYDSHYHSFLEGTLSPEIHSSYTTRLRLQLKVPSIRKWWEYNNEQYTTSFRKHLNELIKSE